MAVYDDTLIETINSLDTLSDLVDYRDTITGLVNISKYISYSDIEIAEALSYNDIMAGLAAVPIRDSVTINDTTLVSLINNIVEGIALAEGLSTSASSSISVFDAVSVEGSLHIALSAIVAENISESDSLQDIISKFATIVNKISIADSITSRADLTVTLAVALALRSVVDLSKFVEELTENFTAADSLIDIFNLTAAIVDAVSIADLPINTVRISVLYSDNFTIADDTFNTADLFNELSEDVVFILTMDDGYTVYQGITMSPETYSVTEYDNYDFNSTTNFQGSYLLAGAAGLYIMGGDLDNGEYISAKIKTATTDFGTSNIKQCPKVYLGINNDASLILRVSVDGKYTSTYQLDIDSQDLTTQIFEIGKGLKGRYWQFELQTKANSSFSLDEIELFPIQWGRKR